MSDLADEKKRPVALVTGASRGIGAACAIALAGRGFDVAIAARTLSESDLARTAVEDGKAGAERPRGSLETTASAIEAAGGRALPLKIDLLDRATLEAAVTRTLEAFGHIDVLVNNAIYQGPGHDGLFLDTPLEELEKPLQANVVSQMALLKCVLPEMIGRGGGIVVQMTSSVSFLDPPGPVGRGGWGIAYAASKGGFDRMAGVLNAELGDRGIRVYNIEPGFVYHGPVEEARERYPGVPITPAEAIGAAVAWLATEPRATRLLGKRISGPHLCAREKLLPGWNGPE